MHRANSQRRNESGFIAFKLVSTLISVSGMEDVIDHLNQFHRNKGLGNEGPAVIQDEQISGIAAAGHQHDANVGTKFLECLPQVRASHTGHVDIGKKKMDSAFGGSGDINRIVTAGGTQNVKFRVLQNQSNQTQHRGIIIDHKNRFKGFHVQHSRPQYWPDEEK